MRRDVVAERRKTRKLEVKALALGRMLRNIPENSFGKKVRNTFSLRKKRIEHTLELTSASS